MPTSGDLKSGDSLFFTTPTPQQIDRAPNGNGLRLYMKSYMKYILSKFTIIVLDAEIIFVNGYMCAKMHQKPYFEEKNSHFEMILSGRFGDPYGRAGDRCHIRKTPPGELACTHVCISVNTWI